MVLVRHGLDEIVLRTHLLRPVRFLLYLLPWNWVRGAPSRRARCGCDAHSRISDRSSSSSARSSRPAATCSRRTSPTSSRASRTACLRSPARTAAAIVRNELGRPGRGDVQRVRPRAAGVGVDRPGARGAACRRAGGGGQGRAPGDREGHPARREPAAPRRGPRAPVLARCAAAPPARGRGRVREDHPRRARPAARGGVCLAASDGTSRAPICSTCRRCTGSTRGAG